MSGSDASASVQRFPRVILIVGGLLLVVGVLVASFYVALGRSADLRWREAEALLSTSGETLDYRTLFAASVPDAENFYAVAPLKDIALIVGGDSQKGEPGEKRRRLEAMAVKRPNFWGPRLSGLNHGVPWTVEDWADCNGVPRAASRPSADTARELLAAMTSGDNGALLAELYAGLSCPRSRLTPAGKDRHLSGFWLAGPHSGGSALMALKSWLGVHSEASSAAGEWQHAVDDVRIQLRLAEAQGAEPSMIDLVSVIASTRNVLEPVWSLLRSGQMSETQIQSLLRDLDRLDLKAVLQTGLRGELAIWADENGGALSQDQVRELLADASLPIPAGGLEGKLARLQALAAANLHPSSVAQGVRGALVLHVLNVHLAPLQRSGLPGLRESFHRYEASGSGTSVFDLPGGYFRSNLHGLYDKAVLAQTRLDQARLACALELYRMKHQHYPAALSELVPEFLAAVPLDVIDGKPMRYQISGAGRYKLWGVGFDAEDDGGKVIAGSYEDAAQPRLDDSRYPGDWVWSYEPLVPSKASP